MVPSRLGGGFGLVGSVLSSVTTRLGRTETEPNRHRKLIQSGVSIQLTVDSAGDAQSVTGEAQSVTGEAVTTGRHHSAGLTHLLKSPPQRRIGVILPIPTSSLCHIPFVATCQTQVVAAVKHAATISANRPAASLFASFRIGSVKRQSRGGFFLGAVLIVVGLVPQYYEIWRFKEVKGISLLFLAIDCAGGVFSLLSLVFKETFDGVAAAK